MTNSQLIQIEAIGRQIATIAEEARSQRDSELAMNAIADLVGDLQEILEK